MLEKKHIEAKTKKKSNNKIIFIIFSYFGKFLKILIGSWFFLIIFCGIAAQFYGFRHWAIRNLLLIVNKELDYNLAIDDMTLDKNGDIVIEKVVINKLNDTIANINRIELDISLLDLIDNRIKINSLNLSNSHLNFEYNLNDSTWNFDHIIKKSQDTIQKQTPNLHFLVKNFNVYNSEIKINKPDFKVSPNSFNPLNAQYSNCNISLDADVKLVQNEFKVIFKSINFTEKFSQSNLKFFKAKVNLNSRFIQVNDLELEANNSKLSMDIRIDNLDILGNGNKDINKSFLVLDLKSKQFEPKYINLFTTLGFNAKKIDELNFTANGSFDDISIYKAELKFANSFLNFNASLQNIIKGNELKYYVDITNSKLITNDLSKILPDISFNNIKFNAIKINQIIGEGTVEGITTNLDFESDFGTMYGDAYFGFGKKIPDYNAQLSLKNFNLGGFLKDSVLRTNFNGEMVVIGSGLNLNQMNTDLRLISTNSQIINYDYKDLILDVKLKNYNIQIDTFKIIFRPITNPNEIVETNDLSTFEGSGFIDLTNSKSPMYDLFSKFSAVNLSRIFNQKYAPEYLTGSIQIKGKSFDLDSIQGLLNSKFDMVVFSDRTLLPFSFNAEFNKNENNEKIFTFNSTYFDLKLEGNFSYSNLINTLSNQTQYLVEFFKEKVDKILPKKDMYSDNISFVNKIRNFEKIDCKVEAHIKDLSPVSLFIPNLEITSKADLNLNIESNSEQSFLRFSKFDLKSIWIKHPDLQLKGNNLFITGGLLIDIKDSLPIFNDFRLSVNSKEKLEISNLLFDSSKFNFNFDGNTLGFKSQTLINNLVNLNSEGNLFVDENQLKIDIDKFKFILNNFLSLENNENIKARFIDNIILIDNFKLIKDSTEFLELTGKFNQTKAELDNINLKAYKLSINKFIKSFNIEDKNIQTIKGVMDTLNVSLNGPTTNPAINISFVASNLNFNNQPLGSSKASFDHKDSVVTGKMYIENENGLNNIKNVQIDVLSLPLNLAFSNVKNRIHSESQFNIIATTKDFNLKAIAPYVPEVTDFKGFADLELFVTGFSPDGITYSGKATGRDISCLTNASNIRYKANGSLEFVKDSVFIRNMNLFNIDEDNINSQAKINGVVTLDGSEIKGFDINVNAKNLLLLSDDSKKSMPNLYGKFRVATPDEPLRFFGTFLKPNLTGSVSVLEGDIIMPRIEQLQNISSNFTYDIKDQNTTLKVLVPTQKDSSNSIPNSVENKLFETKKSFNDNVNYNVYVKFPGKLKVEIELPAFMKMSTVIGMEDKTRPLRYEKLRTSPDMNIYGELLVLNNSTMDFLGKKLNLSGKLTYPTGNLQNPALDMIAQYKGKTRRDGVDKEYEVIIKITGNKLKPQLEFSLNLDGNGAISNDESVRDITYLFAFGKTFADMQRKDQGSQGDLAGETMSKVASASISQVINQIATKFSGTGIKQIDVDFNGSTDKATIRLQGEILDGIEWTLGSSLNNSTATQFQIDIPMSRWTDKSFWQNFIFQTKYVNSLNQVTTPDQILWEGKIKYGNSW